MLRTISPLVSPDLLAVLSRMGHGDEIILADAHFPGHSVNAQTLRADGVSVSQLLGAILPLFPLDTYVPAPVALMRVVPGDTADPSVEAEVRALLARFEPDVKRIARIERMAFYERARHAFAVVMTGETRKYGNVLLKKGVVAG